MDDKIRNAIGLKKFSIISPVLNGQVTSNAEYFRQVASKAIEMPYYGMRNYSVKTDEIIYYIKRVYNLELVELKQQARIYYQTWLRLKDIDNKTAQAAYFEYLDIKRKIELMQVPFVSANAKKRSSAWILLGNFRLYTRRSSSMF